ncbi:MAG: nitroreductase family protein [Syntrophomonadaceae bacterium]|jgi:nitroreductase/NAD-dependent dihydropyrimidine dehydrogenase PreA subunit|nr:nitroreductase family protein [Syntrophomonadaceae bacterium]
MIEIDKELCTDCGWCVTDCPGNCIIKRDGEVFFKYPDFCIECGHCAAGCPVEAVSVLNYSHDEIWNLAPEDYVVDPEKLQNLFRFRRSVRIYRKQEVEPEKLEAVLQAGRYSPTGGNRQGLRYIVLRGQLEEIKIKVITFLNEMAGSWDENNILYGYKEKLMDNYRKFLSKGVDRLFYKAPLVIIIAGTEGLPGEIIDGALAASRMELLASAMGLGVCFIGFFKFAADMDPSLTEKIGLQKKEQVILAMTLGYPGVKYFRTVNRKALNVTYL